MKKKFNLNEFLWFVILLGFTFYFYIVLHTNRIVNFINPRLFKYSYFGLFFLIILTLFQCTNIFSKKRSNNIKSAYILFFIPLFLGLVVNPSGLDTTAASNRGVSVKQDILISHNQNFITNDNINVTNKNFLDVYSEISGKPDNYLGKRISVEGFVYKDEKSKINEFVAARILIDCCAADGQVIGFLCDITNVNDIRKNQWIRVNGILDKTIDNSNRKKLIPVIMVENIEYIKEPKDKYIYSE